MIRRVLHSIVHHCLHPFITYKRAKDKIHYTIFMRTLPEEQKKTMLKLRSKRPLKCVFFSVYHQTWKYDGVYRIMDSSPDFIPIILVCPIVNYGREKMLQQLREDFDFFNRLKYNVIVAYDEKADDYINVDKDINPDIIFYTNPYKGLIDDRYYITNYINRLTVYVPYAYNNNKDLNYCLNQPLHNMVWRYYAESVEHKEYSVRIADNRGKNVVVTGYPGIESFLDNKIQIKGIDWKIKDPHFKKIIWAPHHTIGNEGNVVYSCFLRYAEFMLTMADKYHEDVQFVFKPHPILKSKLDLLWGKERADEYYKKWNDKSNCSINDGDYVDLFLSSDAMIHDSGSFLIEYLYVNKPVLRTLNDIPLDDLYNSFALKCLEHYYMAHTEKEIELFIQNVINSIDPMKEQRTKFIHEVLVPKGSPSQNIIDDILYSIDNQILYRV